MYKWIKFLKKKQQNYFYIIFTLKSLTCRNFLSQVNNKWYQFQNDDIICWIKLFCPYSTWNMVSNVEWKYFIITLDILLYCDNPLLWKFDFNESVMIHKYISDPSLYDFGSSISLYSIDVVYYFWHAWLFVCSNIVWFQFKTIYFDMFLAMKKHNKFM